MRYLFQFFIVAGSVALSLQNCSPTNAESKLFDELIGEDTVVLYLTKYHLDSVPKEIGKLKATKVLSISLDSGKGWTIYPPLMTIDPRVETPPFRELPNEITELTNLRCLFGRT